MKINIDPKRACLGVSTVAVALTMVGVTAFLSEGTTTAEAAPPGESTACAPTGGPSSRTTDRGGRTHSIISTPDAPAAIGPYSQAVKAGNTLYVSGTLPINPQTNVLLGDGSIEEQTTQVLSNLDAILKAAGMTKCDVVSTTVYLADLADFDRFNTTYAGYFGTTGAPARATVQVGRIPRDAKVEIGLIAVR